MRWFVVTLAINAVFAANAAYAQDESARKESENTIIANAVRGEPTDFANLPDNSRTIRSWVIANLLTGAYKNKKLSRFGFTIQNAIFDGPLNLGSIDVPVTLRWENCTFNDTVTFSASHFSAPVFLDHDVFREDVLFNSATADDLLDLNGVRIATVLSPCG